MSSRTMTWLTTPFPEERGPPLLAMSTSGAASLLLNAGEGRLGDGVNSQRAMVVAMLTTESK